MKLQLQKMPEDMIAFIHAHMPPTDPQATLSIHPLLYIMASDTQQKLIYKSLIPVFLCNIVQEMRNDGGTAADKYVEQYLGNNKLRLKRPTQTGQCTGP
jgi:hypothetical protein